MSNIKSIEAQLKNHKEKMDKMAAEHRKLQRKLKVEESRNQEKRAVKRGVMFEKLLPETAKLDEADFKNFLERTVANDFGKRTLRTILAEQARLTFTEENKVTVNKSENPPVKSVSNIQKQSTNDGNNIDIG